MLKSGVCYDLIVYMWLARGLCDHFPILLTVDEEYWGPPATDIEMLGRLTLYRQFYRNQWHCGPLNVRFTRLYDLYENKLTFVTKMNSLVWVLGGEAWRWIRRLLDCVEDQVVECSYMLNSIILQFGVEDIWVWQLHPFKCYYVSSAYQFLASVNHITPIVNSNILWLKAVPLKVYLLVWHLLLNCIPIKDNFLSRGVIQNNDYQCLGGCSMNEDVDHLFIMWFFWQNLVLDFILARICYGKPELPFGSTIVFCLFRWFFKASTFDCEHYLTHFCKERNMSIFQHKEESLSTFCDKIKLQSFRWLKAR